MTRSAAWPLVVVLSLVLAGCASDTATTSGGPKDDASAPGDMKVSIESKPTGLLIEPVDSLKLGYTIDWATHLNLPKDHTVYSAVVLGDLLVTVERPSNLVTGISMKTGRQLWRQQAGNPPYRAFAPSRVDNLIVVNHETRVFILDASKEGRIISRIDLPSAVVTPPAMVGQLAVFGAADGMVFALDTRVGYPTWRYKMPGQVLVPAQASGQQVFVAGIDGQYAMFIGGTGDVIWRGRVFDKVSAPPAVHSSGIYIASEDHSLYAINRATGEDRWIFRYTDDLIESPLVLQNTVYQRLKKDEIIALKVTDGSELWRLNTTDELVGQDSRGLIFDGKDKLIIRDPSTGKLIVQAEVKGKLEHVISTDGKDLIIVSQQGRVLKMSPAK